MIECKVTIVCYVLTADAAIASARSSSKIARRLRPPAAQVAVMPLGKQVKLVVAVMVDDFDVSTVEKVVNKTAAVFLFKIEADNDLLIVSVTWKEEETLLWAQLAADLGSSERLAEAIVGQ